VIFPGLRRLQEERGKPSEKQRISLKYATFQQFTVDQLVRNGDAQVALETAEAGKNTCLKWLLYDWETANHRLGQEAFNWNEVQRLLDATTAIIYWHLSPAALHTFILKQGEVNITLVDQSLQSKERLEKLHQLETWLQDWQQSYQNYRELSKARPENFVPEGHPWRQSMPQNLEKLTEILDIKSIIQKLNGISQLILIPHYELHLLPLHALFELQSEGTSRYTFVYLPSIQAGLRGLNHSEIMNNLGLLSIQPHYRQPGYQPLPGANFEAETIIRLFQEKNRPYETIAKDSATKQSVQDALRSGSLAFLHFTGHASHNFNRPQASMLVLAGDDKLSVKDISNLPGERPLKHFELVSLSACETGATSDQAITHEYVGMASAFIQAGVGQVLSTLWNVTELASRAISFSREPKDARVSG
jgi:CHAT domain-containing protein